MTTESSEGPPPNCGGAKRQKVSFRGFESQQSLKLSAADEGYMCPARSRWNKMAASRDPLGLQHTPRPTNFWRIPFSLAYIPNKVQLMMVNTSLGFKTFSKCPILAGIKRHISYFSGVQMQLIIQFVCFCIIHPGPLITYIKVYSFTSQALCESLRIGLLVFQLPRVHDI